MRDIRRVVIHHSASPRETTTRDMIRGWHLARGFANIGYHFVVEGDGTVRRGRSIPEVGAHVLGENADSIGICVVGDNTRMGIGWIQVQVEATQRLLDELAAVFPMAELFGHRDLAATQCPGVDARRVFQWRPDRYK